MLVVPALGNAQSRHSTTTRQQKITTSQRTTTPGKKTATPGKKTTTPGKKTIATSKTTATTQKATTQKTAQVAQDPDLTYVPRLQRLGESLLEKRQGSIVAIRPKTGEVLCMVSHTLEGNNINRAVSATEPPGTTIKPAQLLTL